MKRLSMLTRTGGLNGLRGSSSYLMKITTAPSESLKTSRNSKHSLRYQKRCSP